MIDIVIILEKFATDKGYFFNYGDKATQNLINWRSDLIITDNKLIYFLLDKTITEPKINSFGSVEGVNCSGWFWLVVKSDFDMIYFNQINNENKYEKNIEPLKIIALDMFKHYGCSTLEINKFSINEVDDLLDENCDGIAVNYNIFVPISYEL